jgi:cyanophycin synthetase
MLVVGGNIVSAIERIPPFIVGDGSSTLAQLVDKENRNPMRGIGHEKPMTIIEIDEIVEAYLAGRHITPTTYVPAKGEKVQLRESANMSTGATARDVTDEIHEETAFLCERAASAVGLNICGIDLKLEDISRPVANRGGVIEVNAGPGIRMHEKPAGGKGARAGEAILNVVFPPGLPSRIPIISITGTNGKTTITRMISHVLQQAGFRVGMTTTEGIWIAGRLVKKGDMTGFFSARTVLSDPLVDIAVLETARGGIVRRGLGYDWSDVSVMSNIQMDHIGQDDLTGIEDILHVKSLVAERVKEGGTLVLNADDPHLSKLSEAERIKKIPRSFYYFSLNSDNPLLIRHTARGGSCCFLKNGWIVESAGGVETTIVKAGLIPVTLAGRARFNISNALAAIAACRALDLRTEAIAGALMQFRAHEHNMGRANLFCMGKKYILLDYGHNPEAFKAIGALAASTGRETIAVLGVPGDRDNSVIEEAVLGAGKLFNFLILREDADPRGRAPGAAAAFMAETLRSKLPGKVFEVCLDETHAVRRAIEKLNENGLLVVFYDRIEPVLEELQSKGVHQEECFLEDLFSPDRLTSKFEGSAFADSP